MPQYGTATIDFISNKNRAAGNMTVLDPCGGFPYEPDGITPQNPADDHASVLLPYSIETETYTGPADGYWVFARILGGPHKGSGDDPDKKGNQGNASSMIIYPNPVLTVCNTTDPLATDCNNAEAPLGLVTNEGVYTFDEGSNVFTRFSDTTTTGKGKGRSIAGNITPLLTWTGWVANATLDISEPFGVLDDADVPGNATAIISIDYGMNPCDYADDCVVDTIEEWLAFQEAIGQATYYDNEWVFNVADIVIQEQDFVNDGTRLMQIRFYPRATTTFN
jgi:hypothetical protein